MNLPAPSDVRAWFPSLGGDFVFMENAGGSQVPGVVADAVRDYMLRSYVQTGAGYPQSNVATKTVANAHGFIEAFMGAGTAGKVVLGPSTTALITLLSNAYAGALSERDEIVIAVSNHEANAGPWDKLQKRGAKIRWWPIDPVKLECTAEGLAPLLNDRTLIVAFPHVSNLIGQVVDLAPIVAMAHAAGAKVVVDGVAFAPHRLMDVEAWDVDWYIYSNYKVFGPHMAAMFGRHEALAEIDSANHFFIPATSVTSKLELGGVNHEGCAGLLALWPYLKFLAGRDEANRATVVAAMTAMEQLERPLRKQLIAGLRALPRVRVLNHPDSDGVPTVSFLVEGVSSASVASAVIQAGIGIRNGNMYSYRLCEALGIPAEDGVVRMSLLHYNTAEEVDMAMTAVKNLLV